MPYLRFMPTPNPCDGCPNAPVCEAQQLACERFARWVSGRVPHGLRIPTQDIYDHIYNDEDAE
jgi:hypothetical protein